MTMWIPYEDGTNFSYPNGYAFVHTGNAASQINVNATLPSTPCYFELTVNSPLDSQQCAGIIQASYSGSNIRINYGNAGATIVCENGAYFNNGSYQGYSLPGLNAGSTLGIYTDGAGNIAMTENGSTWNGSYTTAQIEAGTGLIALGYSGPYVPFVSISGSIGQWTVAASSEACAFTPPTGAAYLSLPTPAAPGATIWTPTALGPGSSDLTISTDGLTVSCISGNPSAQVQSTTGYSSGTIQSIFTYTGGNADECAIGFCESTYSDTSGLYWDWSRGGAAVYVQSGYIAVNNQGSPVGAFPRALASGDVVTVTVNLDAKLVWFQLNGGPPNNNPSAYLTNLESATASQSGGYDISALTLPIYWCAGWHSSSGVDSVAAQFDQAPLILTLISCDALTDEPCNLTWSLTGASASGLSASIDAGNTWIDCGGTTDGTSGVATGPIIAAGSSYVALIRLNGDTTVTSNILRGSTSPTAPTGYELGGIVASGSGMASGTGGINQTFAFSHPVTAFVINYEMDVSPSSVQGSPGLQITGIDGTGNTDNTIGAVGGAFNSIDSGSNFSVGYVGLTPESGPSGIAIGTFANYTATFIGGPSGVNYAQSATTYINGTLNTYYYYDSYVDNDWAWNSLNINTGTIYPDSNPTYHYTFSVTELLPTGAVYNETISESGSLADNIAGSPTFTYTETISESGTLADLINIPSTTTFTIQEYGLLEDSLETTYEAPDQFIISGLIQLLPDWFAWDAKLESESTMTELVTALGQLSVRLYNAATNAPADIFPASTVSLIQEWIAALGGLDPLVPVEGLSNQQNWVVARLTATGGASVPYFQNYIATLLGIEASQVMITQYYPFIVNHSLVWTDTLYPEQAAFTWLITIPEGYSTALVTAEVARIAPAHTIFSVINA